MPLGPMDDYLAHQTTDTFDQDFGMEPESTEAGDDSDRLYLEGAEPDFRDRLERFLHGSRSDTLESIGVDLAGAWLVVV